jgi:ABC-type Mn2+/Zn2+ transport system permease subunit
MKAFFKKFGHVMAHVGLGAIQVGLVAGKFIPPPFNIAVSGGAALASVIIAAKQKPKSSIQITAAVTSTKTP